jgi:hypothetical protein
MIRNAFKIVAAVSLAVVFVVGLTAFSTPAQAVFGGHCICPDVYAPVTCSNGVTYSNGCVASCAHATGCHPSGDI